MNPIEQQVVEEVSLQLRNTVDPVTLFSHKDCNQDLFEKLQAKLIEGSTREEMWDVLLMNIPLYCSFLSFLSALLQSGYVILTIELLQRLWQKKLISIIPGPHRVECKRQDYFLRLKVGSHDQVFKDTQELLMKRSEMFKVRFEHANDNKKKMHFADRYADCLCVLIDTKATQFIGRFPTHNLFASLKAIIPETTNTSLTEVAYYSRLAIAHGIGNEIQAGRECMSQAQAAAFHLEQDVQYVYNMLYIHIHFLCIQAENSTSDDINRILDVTKRFLQSLPGNPGDSRKEGVVFWEKMILLRSAFFLLGISHRGVINELHRVEKRHIAVAKSFLAKVEVHWDGIEYVRKLFYHVCKARIQELEHDDIYNASEGRNLYQQQITTLDFDAAIDQLDKTIKEGSRVQFPELNYAELYSARLHRRIREIGRFRYLLLKFTLYMQIFILFIFRWRRE